VGGGYGGIQVARNLDDIAAVTLVEPRETFVHNVAALRAVVAPEWVERLFIPYDGLLTHGRVVRDRAVAVYPGRVELASGPGLTADYVVLATGSTYPFPAKVDVTDRATAAARFDAVHDQLRRASHVLLLGAGAVGLEFAGEIRAARPGTEVTIVDPAPDLLSGRFPDELRAEVRAQLDKLGVQVLLGTTLTAPPPTEPGQFRPFSVTTTSGVPLAADIWFACYGLTVNTDYLASERHAARRPNGQVAVTNHLRVVGQDRVFAVGDVTDLAEMKQAYLAGLHADVVAANIRALIEGRDELTTYEPHADEIVLPLGPEGGVTYGAEDGLLGPEVTAQIKGDLFIDMFRERLGATSPAR
jgi:NADH dehydrogenase, FAD-containing subunit